MYVVTAKVKSVENPNGMQGISVLTGSPERIAVYAIFLILVVYVLAEALLCFVPPISRDALIHHLAIPKLWIRHGDWFKTP